MATGAIILPGVVVGQESVVAAGSVVTKSVPNHVLVAGVPAVVKRNFSDVDKCNTNVIHYGGDFYMKKKKISKIPIFKNYEDGSNFWDTHSFVDFEDETEDVDIVFELHKPVEETLIVRIQKSLKNQLAKIAKKKE